jgi:hypothetical protein
MKQMNEIQKEKPHHQNCTGKYFWKFTLSNRKKLPICQYPGVPIQTVKRLERGVLIIIILRQLKLFDAEKHIIYVLKA